MSDKLHAPPFVNYDCQTCGWCCRQYDISFSREDYERLSKHDWGALEPALSGKEWCEPLRGAGPRAAFRLRYSPEGACLFLSPDGRCRMHTHVGELGKALGCCMFPFSFVATPSGVYVGCRFSCRAVAWGLGKPVVHRLPMLRKQLALCIEAGLVPFYGEDVAFDRRRTLAWPDYLRLEATLIRVLLRDDLPVVRRLFLLGKFIEILRQARLDKVRGARFAELIGILEEGLFREAVKEPLPGPPAGLWRLMFRQFCFQFQRRQGGAFQELPGLEKARVRLAQFGRGIRFVLGSGAVSLPGFPGAFDLGELWRVRLHDLGEAEGFAVSRFLAAKVFGKQYFGKTFFDYTLHDGLNFLLLSAGAVAWYARARALARGGRVTDAEDVIEAIRYVDFCYGASGAAALRTSRSSIRLLSREDIAVRLAVSQYGDRGE